MSLARETPLPHLPRHAWWLVLLCGATILLAYGRVWRAGYIWDDDSHLTANPCIIGPLGLKSIWTSAEANYFPLVLTNFWVLHRIWGLDPLPYHLVNILFHIGSTFILWRLLRDLRVPGAGWGAMLWALHPVQVESVAWVSELKNTQSGLFYLLAFWFFLRWAGDHGKPHRKGGGVVYACALLSAVLAILSKPSTVMLPVALGLVWWWQTGRWRWRDGVWLLPFLLIAMVAGGWTIWEQRFHSHAQGPEWNQTFPERVVIASQAVWFYLGKLIWPHPLIFIYPRWDPDVTRFVTWILPIGTVAAGAALWWNREQRLRPIFFASAYFIALLFPVLAFFDVYFFRFSFVADHFQYLASIGPLALLGGGVGVASRCLVKEKSVLIQAPAIATLVTLGALTWRQCGMYRDVETIWRTTAELNPSAWIAHNNLGAELQIQGRPHEAKGQYSETLRLKPDDPEAHRNLGDLLLAEGRVPDAIAHLEAALRVSPTFAEACNSLGTALVRAGRVAEGLASYQAAVRFKPDFAEAHANLANQLLAAGRVAEAIDHYEAALRLRPAWGEIHCFVAGAYALLGRLGEAAQHFAEALRLRPGYAEAVTGLAEVRAAEARLESARKGGSQVPAEFGEAELRYQRGNALLFANRPMDAIPYYEEALRLMPGHVDARANLAGALYQLGRVPEALVHYAEIVRLHPDNPEALNNLASALVRLGRTAEALGHYEKAVQLRPNYLSARSNLAALLRQIGRPEAAIKQYEEILRLKPDSSDARNNLSQLRASSPANPELN